MLYMIPIWYRIHSMPRIFTEMHADAYSVIFGSGDSVPRYRVSDWVGTLLILIRMVAYVLLGYHG